MDIINLPETSTFWSLGTYITTALFAIGGCLGIRRNFNTTIEFIIACACVGMVAFMICFTCWPLIWAVALFEMINRT